MALGRKRLDEARRYHRRRDADCRAAVDEEQGCKRDLEMHQSKKGNDWHFGIKAHVGVDAASGLVHTFIGTAGNVADVTQTHALLHGGEKASLGDVGYQGVENGMKTAAKP